jgi:hypothetical protein
MPLLIQRTLDADSRFIEHVCINHRRFSSRCVAKEWRSCPLKARCTRNRENRTITRLAFEEVQEKMAERVAKNPQIMLRRKAIIEHCFGTIKRSLGYNYFLCRGMRNVATEVNLTVLAYNLKRACNLVGVNNLIAAVS